MSYHAGIFLLGKQILASPNTPSLVWKRSVDESPNWSVSSNMENIIKFGCVWIGLSCRSAVIFNGCMRTLLTIDGTCFWWFHPNVCCSWADCFGHYWNKLVLLVLCNLGWKSFAHLPVGWFQSVPGSLLPAPCSCRMAHDVSWYDSYDRYILTSVQSLIWAITKRTSTV